MKTQKQRIFSILAILTMAVILTCIFASCNKVDAQEKTFTITFDSMGGSNVPSITIKDGETFVMPANPTKSGYIFAGWYLDASYVELFEEGISINGNLTLYAKWKIPEPVEGTQAIFKDFSEISAVEYSTKVANITTFIDLSDYVTVNSESSWALSTDIYGNQTIASKTATLNLGDNIYYVVVTAKSGATQLYTLRIRRRPVFTVSFDTVGGTSVDDQIVEEDSLVQAPVTTKEGYSFVSWNFDFSQPITEDKILMASWTANTYKITFNVNGGEMEKTSADVVFNEKVTFNIPTKRGYDFVGWYYNNTLVEDGDWKIPSDVTLDAKWTATVYTISCDLGGGYFDSTVPTAYTVEDNDITIPAATRLGYTFVGWTGTDITTQTREITISSNSIGNREYVANWTLDSYTITYILNGGTNSSNNPETYNVTSDTITFENPTRVGYIFGGWFTAAEFATESKLATILSGSTGNVTVYAKWIPIAYSVVFNKNSEYATGRMGDQAFAYDTAQNLSVNAFERTGYTFDGWNTKADGSGTSYADSETVNNLTTENEATITFYAQWKANTYTITYNANGGEIASTTTEVVFGASFTLNTITKRGYNFDGWYYGDTVVTDGIWDIASDVALDARWTVITYTISYNLDGGKVSTANPNAYTVASTDITLVTPARLGYTFIGWTGTDLSEPTITVTIRSNSIGNREYVANWTLDSYTITYNLNSGVNSEKNPSEYAVTSANIYFENATRCGYAFEGWYTNADCTAESKITTITSGSTGDVELFAKWSPVNYNIKYNLDGGEVDGFNPNSYTIESADITLINPTKRGYTFAGWTGTDLTGVANSVTIRNNSIGDRTYTAVWEIVDYSIKYNLNGGTNSEANPEKYNVASATITLENPTKLGYVFGGWYTSSDFNEGERVKTISNGSVDDIELFAKWSPATYSVKFNKNNSKATGTMDNQTLAYDSADTLIANQFVLVGYTCKGWTTHSDGTGTLYANEQEVLNLSNEDGAIVNVYAKWEANTYTVTFDKNGGVNGTNSVNATYDSAMPTAIAPTYTGYNFAGYYDADGVQYYDSEMNSVRVWDKTKDATLYARWEGKTFTVTFDKENGIEGTSSVAAVFNENMPSASAPSRVGYIFKGYFDERNGAGTQYYSEDMTSVSKWNKSSAATLYAYWEARTYTVSFDYNGGNGNNDDVISTYDSDMPTITDIPTRTGYIFTGYFDAANDGIKYYNADLTSAKAWDKVENTTLYAQWIGVNYSVIFDGNGNTSETMENQSFVYGTSQNLNENLFVRTGYTFTGWNTEADGSGTSYGNSASVNNLTTEHNGTVVLYAQWRANTYKVSLNEEPKSYTVSFNLNGGSGRIPSQTITETSPLTYPTNPTKNGYIFGGWYLDAGCTQEYDFSGVINKDFTLYARWVSCALNNDSSYPWSISGGVLTSTNKKDNTSSTYKITAPVAMTVSFSYKVSSESNYDFLIIKKNGSELKKISGSTSYVSYSVDLNANDYLTFTYSKDSSQSSGSDCAYISGITYTSKVSYSSTATVPHVNYFDVTFGSSFTLSTDISRTGYSFAGWYDGIDGTGTQYTDAEGNSVRVWDKTEDTILYPKWNINQYTISFVSNGGSTVDAITQDYGSEVLEPTKPSWVEKSFVGWFTDSGLTNEYTFDTMPAENITLYAKWIEYTVSLASDETTEISINSTVTSAESYNATAIDTDGNPVNVVVTLIGGTFEAGKDITVRLVATGLYDVYATKTISNIKVYGIPSLEYNTEKDYYNLTDTIDATLWSAIATDTFGGTLSVSLSVKETNYKAGDLVTIVIAATDITGNESKVEIANVKVYGAPVITRNTDKNDMKDSDIVGNEIFGVSAVDSFGEPLTVLTEILSGTIAGGNTIIVKSSAIDSKGNTDYITYSIKVYGLPTISDASKTSFKVDDTISLATLGIVVKDSFNKTLSDVTLALSEGEQTAGQTLTFIVTATDHLGNVQTKTISGIRIYGTPTITFDTAKNAMSVTDDINASLFSAVAKDSHGGDLSIDVTLESGTLAGGSIVTFRLSTKDALGNEYSVVTQDVKVYSSDSIVLTYNAAASSRIKKISKGEEFGASAVDGFGENCTITIEAADGYTIAGGKVINLYIVATDALGNTTRSGLITNIKVYDTPTLKYTRDYPYIQNGDSPYALYLMTDSFGEEILFDVVVVSGSLDVNETIVYRISGKDRAGNLLEETRELVVLDTDESILELYKNGVKIGTQRVYKGSSYTLPKESNSNVAWHLGSLVLTDDNGVSLVAWDKDSNGYIITTEYYTVSYNANGGNVDVTSQLVNVDTSYTNPVPTRVGYTFLGWYSADGTKYTDGIWTTTSDVVLTAKWVANTDTAYVVNHYQQNIEDDEYTLFEQENLTGTSDVKVTPTVKKYVGFTSPYAKNVTIAPDGSLVVNYYYERNYYTIKVVGNGGSDYSVRLKYDTPIDPMSWTSREGYTLGGYYSDLSMTMPYTNTTVGAQNITIYAFWIGDAYYSDFTYTSSTSGVTITGYTGASPIVKVPEQINGQTVVSIASSAFAYNTNIRSINIPDTVENIAGGAFEGCSSLESMTIPFVGESRTASKSYQLFGYIFGTSSYDGGVATTQYYSSEYRTTNYIPSSLKSVTVTGGNILYGAFYNCSGLKSVIIGDCVTSIGYSAFNSCTSLTSVTIGDGVTSIGYYAFYGCSGLTSITIPNSVTSICDWTFWGCSGLTSVTIPNNVTSIGYRAFDDCSGLTSVTIGNSVTRIDYSAFSGCSSLETITIPFVGAKAGVTSSDTYQYPFGYIFGEDSYDGGVATTQYYYGSSTSSMTSTTYYIPSSLKSVTVTGGNILCGAFYNCSSLTNITIPDTVTSIGGAAFYNCSGLTSITIPDSVTSIGNSAFYDCSRLTSVTIPNSVTSIGGYAFSGCSSLETITIPFVGAKAGVTSSYTYQYPFGHIFGTSRYTGSVATEQYYLGSSTSSTTSTTYYIPSSLKSVTVTGGNILYGAFYNCSSLTSVTIPDSVKSIGNRAFYNCSGLTSITIPDSVTSIGASAFYGCSGLTSIDIPDSVTSIGASAFNGCTGLTSITIGSGVTSIGDSAFYVCIGLTSINFNGTKAQWNAISKGWDWKRYVPSSCKVYCTDGTISI